MSKAGARKSAILLMTMGEERASLVLRSMTTADVEKIGRVMAGMGKVSREEIIAVLEEFRLETEQMTAMHLDSDSFFRNILEKALGENRASTLIDEIVKAKQHEDTAGIERLNTLESGEVAELIRDEHPQIIATLMVHLDRKKASEILEKLTPRLRHDVVLRIATFGGVQPTALKELTEVLTEMLSGESLQLSRLGGVRTAAEIVNLMSSSQEEEVMAHVREHDESLAQLILDEMFVFENLLGLEDRSIQRLLKDIETSALVTALKGAPEALRDKFLKNMSKRGGEAFREEMELRGPVRVSEVETEQKAILQIARTLADAGEITLSSPGSDEFI